MNHETLDYGQLYSCLLWSILTFQCHFALDQNTASEDSHQQYFNLEKIDIWQVEAQMEP